MAEPRPANDPAITNASKFGSAALPPLPVMALPAALPARAVQILHQLARELAELEAQPAPPGGAPYLFDQVMSLFGGAGLDYMMVPPKNYVVAPSAALAGALDDVTDFMETTELASLLVKQVCFHFFGLGAEHEVRGFRAVGTMLATLEEAGWSVLPGRCPAGAPNLLEAHRAWGHARATRTEG
ncbi:MAG: hypothetical protein WCF85_18225 [Rhodospirillaceae bacterium]